MQPTPDHPGLDRPSPLRTASPREAVRSLSPRDVRRYAVAHNWTEGPKFGNGRIFERAETREQFLLPLDRGVDDYEEALLAVARKLTEPTDRSLEEVLARISHYEDDLLSYRVASSETASGSLPLKQAGDLLQGATKALLAAAHSVEVAKLHHPKLNRSTPRSLLEKCELEQTQRGSFVLTIACPLDAVQPEDGGLFDATSDSFARLATTKLDDSLQTLDQAIREDAANRIVDAEEPSVTGNLCEALILMRPEDERGTLTISTAWAAARPRGNAGGPATFDGEAFEAIEDIYRQLRATEPPASAERVAFVRQLHGQAGPDGRVEGDVTLVIASEEENLNAKAFLTADQYEAAMRAHRDSQPMLVQGKLARGPKLSRLTEILKFDRISNASERHPDAEAR